MLFILKRDRGTPFGEGVRDLRFLGLCFALGVRPVSVCVPIPCSYVLCLIILPCFPYRIDRLQGCLQNAHRSPCRLAGFPLRYCIE